MAKSKTPEVAETEYLKAQPLNPLTLPDGSVVEAYPDGVTANPAVSSESPDSDSNDD